MNKTDQFLDACKRNLGHWTCSLHTTGSNQPAAIFREAKNMGYEFEEVSKGRWGSKRHCARCGQDTTHYKLLKAEPTLTRRVRLGIDRATRNRILRLFDSRDAFTGGAISSTPEIDHKVPWTRLDEDIDATKLTDAEVRGHFQLLTREHNLLKDRACGICKREGRRPPFLEIPFWYEGDEAYRGSCEGCGWFDGARWRREVAKRIGRKDGEDGFSVAPGGGLG